MVVASLALRLAWLGRRVAHWDEARHAVHALAYARTGVYQYHPVLHGPLLFHAEALSFHLLGPTDAAMRLPVALVGAALPAAAWLYRDHLDDAELLGVGVVLAANPLLVYYSRFARNDVLVAAFAIVLLGAVLRARATGRRRYVALAAVALALGVASKENVVLYLAAWTGAGLVVGLWHPAVAAEGGVVGRLRALARRALRGGRDWAASIAVGIAAFLALTVVLYAPRGTEGPTVADLADPGSLPAVVAAATIRPARQVIAFWLFGPVRTHSPVGFTALLTGLLVVGAGATLALAVWALRGAWRARPLLAFAGVWAGLSLFGYPFATDLMAGWIAVHVVVALAIPGGVGLARLGRSVRARPRTTRRTVALAMVVAYLVVTVGATSFLAPGARYDAIGQPSQMSGEVRPALAAIESADADGPEVAYVGPYFSRANWVHRLPFAWYVQRSGAETVTVESVAALDDPPPVVIALEDRRAAVEATLPDHRCRAFVRVPWLNMDPGGFERDTVVCRA